MVSSAESIFLSTAITDAPSSANLKLVALPKPDPAPVINATFSQPKGKQFIAKLQPDISNFIYSTTFGKGAAFPDISPTAFLVDRCENVYVAGWGGGIETEGRGNGAAIYSNSKTFGLTVTNNAIKKTTDGDDFYFFVCHELVTPVKLAVVYRGPDIPYRLTILK